MESIEVKRRRDNATTAVPCIICKEIDFSITNLGSVIRITCNHCGHIDYFLEIDNANKDGSNQTISNA